MLPAIKFGCRYLFVLCLIQGILVACASSSTSGGSLTGVVWQLTNVKFDGQSTSNIISEPEKYTIEFQRGVKCNMFILEMKSWVFERPVLQAINYSVAQYFLYFSLTSTEGDAIIMRVQGRLAQLVRALR